MCSAEAWNKYLAKDLLFQRSLCVLVLCIWNKWTNCHETERFYNCRPKSGQLGCSVTARRLSQLLKVIPLLRWFSPISQQGITYSRRDKAAKVKLSSSPLHCWWASHVSGRFAPSQLSLKSSWDGRGHSSLRKRLAAHTAHADGRYNRRSHCFTRALPETNLWEHLHSPTSA